MNIRTTPAVVLLALLAAASVSPAGETDSEFAAFLDAYTAAWNTHDGDALAAFFTVDADMIMGNLPRTAGREAIGDWWKTYFSRLDQGRQEEFGLLSLTEIAPGVRLANVSSKTFGTNKQGEELETRLARGTWVVVKRHGDWLIAALRAFSAEGEHRMGPGRDR